MSNDRNYDVLHLFQTLDAPFLRYDKTKIEPIVWNTKDFSVLTRHEVKVPAVAGSTVKFVFSTVGGDIAFELQFQTSSNSQSVAEVIRESAREPSDLEPIKGSYKADYDGIFIFIFDNSFSWFTDKSLSYTIHLLQPAFALADSNRALQSRRLLKTILEESRQAKQRLVQTKERSSSLNLEINAIQARMIALQQELSNKKAIVEAAEKELQECAERIAINEAKKAGLCIRCLDKKSLSNVLSFLGKQAETRRVSKYWKALVDEL